MGLFGFGKKKSKKEAEPAVEPVDEDKVAAAEANAAAKAESAETVLAEPASEYQGRGEERGPWDVNDEDVPDYDDYLDLGAYYLPFLRGIQLRIKANRATQQVLGSTITFGSSSLEIEAFAAPKTLGLWDDVRGDLLEANKAASEVDGVFGTELKLPVNVKGRQDREHAHRWCGRPALDAAWHLLRQGCYRSGQPGDRGAEQVLRRHRRRAWRGAFGAARSDPDASAGRPR